MARWFKRRGVVSEAGEYLKATDVVSRPVAILITVVAFVLIAGLLFGVFLGGKWAYERLTGNDDAIVDTTSQDGGAGGSGSQGVGGDDGTTQLTDRPAVSNTPTTIPSGQSAPAPAPATTPSTGPGTIPDTGPGGGN